MEKLKRVEEIESRLEAIDIERAGLLKELRDLRAKERSTNPSFALDERAYPETAAERVAIFERLFVARKDVYPQMWENAQNGRNGYFPVCETIWDGGRRLKPTEIFARFEARKFERLSLGVVEAHLRGQIVAGTYAIRSDNTCIFLAADFDGDGWQGDAGAYRDEASRLGIECLVEISRSGNGAHVWILFAEPVQAAIASRLGSLLLAKTAARHPHLRLDTYDRFFPNQDFLPKGGFGNLIALPLQKERRADGCTEFVDEFFVPHPDQWQVLSAVRRLNPEDLRAILDEHLAVDSSDEIPAFEVEEQVLRSSQDDTLELPVLPDWKAWFAENLIIPTENLSDRMAGRLKALATIPNPEARSGSCRFFRRCSGETPRLPLRHQFAAGRRL